MTIRIAVFLTCFLAGCGFAAAQAVGQRPVDRARMMLGPTAQTTQKIVGGKPAVPGRFPFQIALIAAETPAGQEQRGQFCGGTLVDANWVLTAAHCVPNTAPEEVDVYVGSVLLPTSGKEASAEAARIHVGRIISHQRYDRANHDNDIALLKLAGPVPQKLTPVAVASAAEHALLAATGKAVTVVGWGATKEGGPTTPRLMEVSVKSQDSAICLANYQNYSSSAQLTANMFCAGEPAGGKDSCQGDSGGFIGAESAGAFRQLGIVSWGLGCARPGLFGVYTKVANYQDWITKIMQTF